MNISIVNGFVLQNLQTDRRRRWRHFDFHLLLAKQLISDFNSYKKHSSARLVAVMISIYRKCQGS